MSKERTLSSLCKSALVAALFVSCFSTGVVRTSAQSSLSVTVTPPLFQLSIGPGESWTSTLKIVNSNPYDVTYYAQVMDMQANGEDGRSKFIPIVDESNDPAERSYALAHWIHISSDPIEVKAGSSQDVPFSVLIPDGAEPGGHYAAILVGTQPGGIHATGSLLKISSYVSSLLFVRIKGDTNEGGRIREFLSTQQLYQSAKADFLLRFENTGNTHVRPQGDITIYNMWGKERGKVLINQDADGSFGNVLPKSVRRFQFSWAGSDDLFDIGLYSAVVTLAFGDENKQNVTGKTYFWVIPVVPVSITLGCVLFFILSIFWLIRRYIRKALELEQRKYGMPPHSQNAAPKAPPSIVETLIEPMREGVVDLRAVARSKQHPVSVVAQSAPVLTKESLSVGQWVKKYRLFVIFLMLLAGGSLGAWMYFHQVLVGKKGFQITDVHIQAESPAQATLKVGK